MALRNVQTPPICLYKVANVYGPLWKTQQEVLLDAAQSLSDTKPMASFSILGNTPLQHTIAQIRESLVKESEAFKNFSNEYQQTFKEYQEGIAKAKQSVEGIEKQLQALNHDNPETTLNQQKSELIKQRTNAYILLEKEAGKLEFARKSKQQQAIEGYFSTSEQLTWLKNTLCAHEEAFTKSTNEAWDEALKYANTSELKDSKLERDIEKIAGWKPPVLSKDVLIQLYLRQDTAQYQEISGLSLSQIEHLHQLTHKALLQAIELAQLQRCIEACHHRDDLKGVASALMSDMPETAKKTPELVLFQYHENILLREKQTEALQHLLSQNDTDLGYSEYVEKLIMGGGKSKVLLPLLAYMKCNGHSLTIFEVPPALLQTNYSDLSFASKKLFGQDAHILAFHRNSDCSPQRLEELAKDLANSIHRREYWVTTGSSIQSLELKYLELLLQGKPHDPENAAIWSKQIYWLGQINHNIMHRFADATIDEVHRGLWLKQEVNYNLDTWQQPVSSTPTNQSVDPLLIQLSVKLYRFLDVLAEPFYANDSKLPRHMQMQTAWLLALKELPTALLTHPQSPLKSVMESLKTDYGETIYQEVQAFLNNQADLNVLSSCDPVIQDTLSFYQGELNALLPHTLTQKHGVHYGPADICGESQSDNALNPVTKVIAHPYIGNSKPAPLGVDFANLMIKINDTIQSLQITGIQEDLLKDMIQTWIEKARKEMDDNPHLMSMRETIIAQSVNLCLAGTGYTLEALDPENKDMMKDLCSKTKYNKQFIFNMLEHNILEKIEFSPDTLRSNAIHHASQYHSLQGLTGTPNNFMTYHLRLQFNRDTSLGIDDYLLNVLQEKNTPIYGLEVTNIDDFLSKLFAKIKNKQPRALIDVGARLTGIDNLTVARALANYWTQQTDQPIAYILYFNENNVLCALNVKNLNNVVLNTSDPKTINRLLGCSPAERFTYYDDAHTVGADIKQAQEATGIVLVDKDTQIQDFLQSCMRMRGLEEQQTIEIVVPETLEQQGFVQLITHMQQNSLQALQLEAFHATVAKLENVVRHEALQIIYALPDEQDDLKAQYAKTFCQFFVKSDRARLYNKFGHIAKLHSTSDILEQYKKQLLDQMRIGFQTIGILSEDTDKRIENTMTEIITTSLPDCPDKIHASLLTQNKMAEKQKHMQKEMEVELQKEKELFTTKEKQNGDCTLDWTLKDLLAFTQNQGVNTATKMRSSMNDTYQTDIFSANLSVSSNYFKTYQRQKKNLDSYAKPVHAILFAYRDNHLHACIITVDEIPNLRKLINESDTPIWISTTQNSILEGQRPADICDDETYKACLEQIHFFNGDWGLINRQNSLYWLTQRSSDKLSFYEQHLAACRQYSHKNFALVTNKLSKIPSGIHYLEAHRFTPMAIDWHQILPGISNEEFCILQKFSEAFDKINQQSLQYLTKKPINWLNNMSDIPIEYLFVLEKHANVYQKLLALQERLTDKNFSVKVMPEKKCLNLVALHQLLNEGSSYDLMPKLEQLTSSDIEYFFDTIDIIQPNEWAHIVYSEIVISQLNSHQLSKLLLKHGSTMPDNIWQYILANRLPYQTKKPGSSITMEKGIFSALNDEALQYNLLQAPQFGERKKYQMIKSMFNKSTETCKHLLLKTPVAERTQIFMKLITEQSCQQDLSRYNIQMLTSLHPSLPWKQHLLTQKDALLDLIGQLKEHINPNSNDLIAHFIKKLETSLSRNRWNAISWVSNQDNQKFLQQISPDKLLQVLQSLCESQSVSYGFWKSDFNHVYQRWLNEYHANDAYQKAGSISQQELQRLAESQDILQTLAAENQYEHIPLPDTVFFMSEWEDYYQQINALKQQFPHAQNKLEQLLGQLKAALNAPDPDHEIKQAISDAHTQFEQETGLWGVLKPILNSILTWLAQHKLYTGELFVSNISKTWEVQQLDIHPSTTKKSG